MVEYWLVTATKDGETKTFQAQLAKSLFADKDAKARWYVSGLTDFNPSLVALLAEHGWTFVRTEPLPEHYITERRTWTVREDTVVLEISDSLMGYSWRLNVNGQKGEWRGQKSNEVTSADGRYAVFSEYWSGYFPNNTLVELVQHKG